MTANELTLGMERLGRLGDTKGVEALRKLLAERLELGSLGKFSLRPTAPPGAPA